MIYIYALALVLILGRIGILEEVIEFAHTYVHLAIVGICHLLMHSILKLLHICIAEVLHHLSRVELHGLLPLIRRESSTDWESILQKEGVQAVAPQVLRVRVFLNQLRHAFLLRDIAGQCVRESSRPGAGS